FINWSIAWQGVKERPVLGWGQENYALVFDKYYDPRMYAQEPWFDRVHNIVFDWLVAGGFLGLLTYLSIFGAALYALWRKGFSIPERSILTGLLAAYFCHNFFVFDNVTSYILFGTVLAYIMYRSSEATGAQPVLQRGLLPESALPYAALVSALLIWGVAWGVNGNALTANRMLLESLQPQSAGLMTNLSNFEETIALHTYGTQEAREQLSQGAAQIAGSPTISADIKKAFADATVRELKAQAAESPLDARFPLFLGVAQDAFGDYANAAVSLQKAHELSPKKQSIYFELAQNAQLRGDTSAALGFFKSAFELETDYNDARFYYAAALIRAGQDGKAQELIAPLIPTGEAADQRILAAYVAKKEYIKAAPLWKAHIAAKPDDAQAYFTLAAIYYEAGDKVNAIAALEAAKLAIPGVATQADPLIRQIQNGTVQM
ncbi:tetratricopeptide repeat protein, partial [Candidatus Kaiserbacteria bacterium]|nr:tetratricopeptide repeat protein [Candidatus Kaiserbacteria bacterium]